MTDFRPETVLHSISPLLAQFDPVVSQPFAEEDNNNSLIDLTSHTPVLNSLQTSVLSPPINDNQPLSINPTFTIPPITREIPGVTIGDHICLRPPPAKSFCVCKFRLKYPKHKRGDHC